MIKIVCYVDGGAKPNPGQCYGSFLVFKDGQVEDTISIQFTQGTNNQAEYWALIHLLDYLVDRGHKDATIRMDSLLVLKQVTKEWQVKQKTLAILNMEVDDLLDNLGIVRFEHISEKQMKKILGH